jgi:hypothetical protein
MSQDPGVVDITNLAEAIRQGFVSAGSHWLTGKLIIAFPFAAWFIKSFFAQNAIKWVMDKISEAPFMGAYFVNTAIRKHAQADAFLEAVNAVRTAKEDISDEAYKELELEKIRRFNHLVVLSN